MSEVAEFCNAVISYQYRRLTERLGTVRVLQIGANDGSVGSPVKPYIDGGKWHGVLVEPVPYLAARLRERMAGRPEMHVLQCAVAAQPGIRPFYVVRDRPDPPVHFYHQISSLDRANVEKHANEIPDIADWIVETTMQVRTVSDIVAEFGAIDALVVDAEGADEEILRSVDWTRCTPSLVLFENMHLPAERELDLIRLLKRHSYNVMRVGGDTFAGRSDFFSAEECAHWTNLLNIYGRSVADVERMRPIFAQGGLFRVGRNGPNIEIVRVSS